MIKQLLVPLDGSHLAESVLPAASLLAEKLGAAVTLLHLVEQHPPQTVHGDHHLTTAAEALAYLDDVAARAFSKTIAVERHVHEVEVANVPSSIADHALEMKCDLIVLCTHGQSGLRQLLFGSIAQQVVALGTTPVLLLRPDTAANPFKCSKVLVPLDGKPAHEPGMALAGEMAKACGGSLRLVMVVPTLETLSAEQAGAGRLLPGAMAALLDLTEEEAHAYLAAQMESQQAMKVEMAASVERGDPAQAILAAAAEAQADLIVLTTHGKRGAGAFWSGSVAPKVVLRSQIPLLLVRAQEE